jgi:hypothetical protein
MNPPWLTKEEIDDFCRPLKQPAAQIRHLRSQGLTVRKKPNGDALVMRSHFEQVMNPVTSINPARRRDPNRTGLIASFEKQA